MNLTILRFSLIHKVLLLVFLIFATILYFRWFERHAIFFPTREFTVTPRDVGFKYEDIYFSSDRGVVLHGWFIPGSQDSYPHVLFCHGNGGNVSHCLDRIELLHSLGANVFLFDYRGYGKSSGRPSEKGTYSDAIAAYKYLRGDKKIRPGQIVVYGHSLGGAIAVDLVTRVDVAALICEGAFTSTLDIGRELYPFLPVSLIVTMKYDALAKIHLVNVPKLLIHSKEDEIVPFHHGKRLFDAAIPPKEFYETHGGHNDSIFTDVKKTTEKLEAFLASI